MKVYADEERIASHLLFADIYTNHYHTRQSDLPEDKTHSDWDEERVRQWAKRIGTNCQEVTERLFESASQPDSALDHALAVLRLSKRYGSKRLDRPALWLWQALLKHRATKT